MAWNPFDVLHSRAEIVEIEYNNRQDPLTPRLSDHEGLQMKLQASEAEVAKLKEAAYERDDALQQVRKELEETRIQVHRLEETLKYERHFVRQQSSGLYHAEESARQIENLVKHLGENLHKESMLTQRKQCMQKTRESNLPQAGRSKRFQMQGDERAQGSNKLELEQDPVANRAEHAEKSLASLLNRFSPQNAAQFTSLGEGYAGGFRCRVGVGDLPLSTLCNPSDADWFDAKRIRQEAEEEVQQVESPIFSAPRVAIVDHTQNVYVLCLVYCSSNQVK